jgi:hypothetical protein
MSDALDDSIPQPLEAKSTTTMARTAKWLSMKILPFG